MNKKLKISIWTGITIGAVLISGITAAKISVHGKLPAGTTVAGIDLSYKTTIEAEESILEAKEIYFSEPIKITVLGETKRFLPEDLGVEILVEETLSGIKSVDSKNSGLLNTIINSSPTKKEHPLKVRVNGEKVEESIIQDFQLERRMPKQASLFFESGGRLGIKKEEEGKVVNWDELISNIKKSAENLSSEGIFATTETIHPEITKELIEEQMERIERGLNQRTTLIDPIYIENWYIRLTNKIDWVEFRVKENELTDIFSRNKETPKIEISIKMEKLNEYVDENISRWLDKEADHVSIYKNEDGEVIIEGKGSDGKRVDRKMLKESFELAVNNGITEITVPVLHIDPELSISEELKELGIKERIGVGHSSYYGSPWNRVHNIKISAARYNGILVEPNEVVSFNRLLGPVNAAMGYRRELVIKPEGTVPEYGGGICQTSTTFYRAAILSGLPIVERHPHSYAVRYYAQVMGHGLDATIYLGGPDVKFKNDTGNHILIQTYVKDDYELYYVFYGTSDVRSVEMEGPFLGGYHNPGPTIYEETSTLPKGQTKQVENRHVGFYANWKRIITRADGTIEEEQINTRYRAIPAKILVGTAE